MLTDTVRGFASTNELTGYCYLVEKIKIVLVDFKGMIFVCPSFSIVGSSSAYETLMSSTSKIKVELGGIHPGTPWEP